VPALQALAIAVLAVTAVAVSGADDGAPPLELVADNVRAMPYTACVQIADVSEVPERQAAGYVTFKIEAAVIERIRGDAARRIAYLQTVEAPARPPAIGRRILVSLQQAPDGTRFVPDNGYVFPASAAAMQRARAAAAKLRPKGAEQRCG